MTAACQVEVGGSQCHKPLYGEGATGAAGVPHEDPAAARTPWESAVEAFLREKRRANVSPSTLETYRFHLVGPRVQAYLSGRGIRSVEEFGAESSSTLELELADAGCRPAYIATYHGTLKNFLGFCKREGIGVDATVFDVSGPRRAMVSPGIISPEEEKRLLTAARNPRDRFLVEFLMRTGLRRNEAATVTIDDIKEGP